MAGQSRGLGLRTPLSLSLAWGVLAVGVVVAGLALARGRDMEMSQPSFAPAFDGGRAWYPSPEAYAPPRYYRGGDEGEGRPVHHKRLANIGSSSGGGARYSGKAVCVRLCDGSFFPAASAGAGDAGCASQCPGAPTELYSMGADRIEDAVSVRTGTPYTKLPVAKRFEASHEATCTCHREAVASHAEELLHDSTLRKGDVVMTDEGFRVFEGSGWGPVTAQDFVPVAKAGVSKSESAELAAMEHSSAGRAPISAPTMVADKPKSKGNVIVDNGTP